MQVGLERVALGKRVWEENRRVYGARKVWRQLRREGVEVAVAPSGESAVRRLFIDGREVQFR